jgi:hypothetical protein
VSTLISAADLAIRMPANLVQAPPPAAPPRRVPVAPARAGAKGRRGASMASREHEPQGTGRRPGFGGVDTLA